jgi:hypothetical protein
MMPNLQIHTGANMYRVSLCRMPDNRCHCILGLMSANVRLCVAVNLSGLPNAYFSSCSA